MKSKNIQYLTREGIKNIGIIHNREFEQGVLRIEFYDKDAVAKATKVLDTNGYHIYIRK